MKLVVLLLLASAAFAQKLTSDCTAGPAGQMRAQLQSEIQETDKLIGGMNARVLMLRNNAGTIQNFNVRDALQIDADLWQSLIDHMKAENLRRQQEIDSCNADGYGEKKKAASPK